MPNLNIVGNGFDLYHGLPTSYYYFACYILSTNEKLYDELAEMYGFSKGVIHPWTEECERKIDDAGYWRNFENKLSYLSSGWVENSLMDDLGLECSDAVSLEISRQNLSDTIKETLKNWIIKTVDTEKNFEIVREMIGEKKLKFSTQDTFISFNYTHTLEKIYDVRDVLHIHGETGFPMDVNDLVIGHGDKKTIDELHEKISKLSGYDYRQAARNRKLEYQFEKKVMTDLLKPIGTCSERLSAFINKIDKSENIYVYGFSLGDVDMPYIQLINKKFPSCKWKFSYYLESDIDHIKRAIKILGLENTQYDFFELKNSDSNQIKDRLVVENRIDEFPTFHS